MLNRRSRALRAATEASVHRAFKPSVVTIAIALALGVQPLDAAEAYRKLSAAEIKARVGRQEITDDAHFSPQYLRDGTVLIVTMSRCIVGKWRVPRGQLCVAPPKRDDARCAEVWVHGQKAQLRAPNDPVPFDVVIQKLQDRGWGKENRRHGNA